jgi:PAB1-binding protein PBP1
MKNLFNNISESEKNRILEMHSGMKKTLREDKDVKDMSDTELGDTFVDHIGGRFNPDTESEDDFMSNRFEPGAKSYMDTDFYKERIRRASEKKRAEDAQPKRLPDDIQDKLYRKHKMMYNQHDNHQDWEDAFSAGIHKVKDESDKYRENPNYDFGFDD